MDRTLTMPEDPRTGVTVPLPDAGPDGTVRDPRAHPGAGGTGALTLDRYRLERCLGRGGFGSVWLAHDEHLGRSVAVKLVPRIDPTPPRAAREAVAAARLNHPGIVALYEAADDPEFHVLVSELVAGSTLAELMAAGALSDLDVLRLGTGLCEALDHAHHRGVIHRDVKPQNIIVPAEPDSDAGLAKLTDFGVAHLAGEDPLTRTGDVVGTLAYMAPEQAEGRETGPSADLYALALVLYEALSGSNPVRRSGPAATARLVGTVLPPLHRRRRDLPPELCDALDAALLPLPEDRGTLADLKAALIDAGPLVSDEGGTLPRPHRQRVRTGWPGRLACGAAAGGLAVTAAAGLATEPPASLAALGACVAVIVAALPRAGWALAACALLGWLALSNPPLAGTALVLAPALAACPPLLWRDGAKWSIPAAAPVLGLAWVAGAYPAVAGSARSALNRACLGALGFAWLCAAEPLLERTLFLGPAPGTPGREAWQGSIGDAAQGVLWPLASSGILAGLVLWAVAALVLPWLVAGRSLVLDMAGAAVWAGGLAFASDGLADLLRGQVAQPVPRGALAGAVLGAAAAVIVAHVRRDRESSPVP